MSRSERGSGTVLIAAWCAAVLVTGLMAALVTGAAQAAASARAAADLGAIAGAGAALDGLLGASTRDPCTEAAWIARGNGATITSCTIDQHVNVTVAVSVQLSGALARVPGLGQATARSRAGPAPPSGAEPE